MMSLPLNQTNPQLNDLLLRGGSSLSPELKEQAIDDILAEFGSAPTKKAAKQAVPAQKQPASPAPSAPLVIDGVDFSEFLDNAPASRKTAAAPIPDPQPIREPVKTPEANKPPRAGKVRCHRRRACSGHCCCAACGPPRGNREHPPAHFRLCRRSGDRGLSLHADDAEPAEQRVL